MSDIDCVSLQSATDADVETARDILLAATDRLLARGIAQWSADDFSLERVRRWAGELDIARKDGVAAGCLRLSADDPDVWPEMTVADPPALVLHSLAVRREHAGHGLGRRLIDLAAEEARRRGAALLRLDCWAGNDRLRRYYAEAGFEYVGDITVSVARGEYVAAKFERTV